MVYEKFASDTKIIFTGRWVRFHDQFFQGLCGNSWVFAGFVDDGPQNIEVVLLEFVLNGLIIHDGYLNSDC